MLQQKISNFSTEELDISADGYRTFTLPLSELSGKAEVETSEGCGKQTADSGGPSQNSFAIMIKPDGCNM